MTTPPGQRWVAPPNWPQPEPGFVPPPGWKPNPAWGPAPEGWQFWQPADPRASGWGATPPPTGKPWGSKRGLAILAGAALLLGSCVAAIAGSGNGADTTATAPSSTPKTPSAPQASAQPKPAKDPLDTQENDLACKSARREVSERAEIFTGVSQGTALPADAAKAAGELQKDTKDYSSFATGPFETELIKLSNAYGRMRVSLLTGDVSALQTAVKQQNTSLSALDKLCSRIGS